MVFDDQRVEPEAWGRYGFGSVRQSCPVYFFSFDSSVERLGEKEAELSKGKFGESTSLIPENSPRKRLRF